MHSKYSRVGHDLPGKRAVPRLACYGIHTLRAAESFAIGRIAVSSHRPLVKTSASASVNLNTNEAIANQGLALNSHASRCLHPDEHVNLGCRRDDMHSAALRVAASGVSVLKALIDKALDIFCRADVCLTFKETT